MPAASSTLQTGRSFAHQFLPRTKRSSTTNTETAIRPTPKDSTVWGM